MVGLPAQYCVELQNPMTDTKVVTLTYSVADFGAGIAFTPVGTRRVTLPPNSIDRYCLAWTPASGGTLHRCLLVEIHQPGFLDQRSQRNLELVHAAPVGPSVHFTIGNPAPFTRTLSLHLDMIGTYGLLPHLMPFPAPDVLGPGQIVTFTLDVHVAAPASQAPPGLLVPQGGIGYGDTARVEVGVYLGGELTSGFTVEFVPPVIYLPVLKK